jgi:hypothetical protein
MAERPSIIGNLPVAGVRTDMFDVSTNSMSTTTLWEKSYLCPCRNIQTKQPNQACPRCHGRGIGFLSPQKLEIIIQSEEKGVYNGDIGIADSGTAIGTPADRMVRLAFRDRITLVNTKVSQSFIFDVTERRVKNGFYMTYDVQSIEFATTMEQELMEGEDYEFDRAKNLFIPKPHLLNKVVSINIWTTLRYLIADLLKEHRYAPNQAGVTTQMQQKLLLKREDIFIDKEAFSIGVDNEELSEMIDTKRPPNLDGLNGFFGGRGANG